MLTMRRHLVSFLSLTSFAAWSPALWAQSGTWEFATAPRPTSVRTPTPSTGAERSGTPLPTKEADAQEKWRLAGTHEMLTLSGSTGLLRVANATGAPAGTFRVQALYEYFRTHGFLCNARTPCGRNGEDQARHFGTTLAASAAFTSFLEGYVALRAYANENTGDTPTLLQVIGDTTLGAKVVWPAEPYRLLNFGGDAQLLLLNGSGGIGLSAGGTSGRFRGNTTLDFRRPDGGLPLLIHGNVGYKFDNSGAVISGTERARSAPIRRVERFGIGISRVDALEVGLAAEGVFTPGDSLRFLRPFVEYTIDIPINRQGYVCNPARSSSGDACLGNDASFASTPSRLTLGARANPFLKGLMATAAVDIGLSGTSKFLEEVTPQAPWTLWLGLGYGFDTVERITPAPPPPPPAREEARPVLRGLVHEQGKPEGIAGAVVMFESRDGQDARSLTGLVTNPAGHFVQPAIEAGTYVLRVKAEGYKEATCTASVVAPVSAPAPAGRFSLPGGKAVEGSPAPEVDCPLEALPRLGVLVVHVVNAEGGAAMAGATVTIVDVAGKERAAVTDANGDGRLDGLPLGAVTIRVTQNDAFGAIANGDIKGKEDTRVTVSLSKRPKNASVTVGKKEIVIKQQIHFETDSAKIATDSNLLLQEIADVLVRTPRIKLVEIQGHTDNTGPMQRNKVLSQERADSVRERLIANDVNGSRLQAKGFGSDRPLVPNVTAGNRSRNRRVAFVIIEQDPEGATSTTSNKTPTKDAFER